ncbi:MAG: enoyl-CoA hydratase-related protein [Hyphomonas sp.]
MSYATILTEYSPETGVAVITLHRADASNALNEELVTELAHALDRYEGIDKPDERARCIILTGSKKVFSIGLDMADLVENQFPQTFINDRMGRIWRRLEQTRVPVIAAVSGYALGAGCELALMCDVVMATETTKFGLPQIRRGGMPALGATQRLGRYIGKAKAMDLCLSGRMMDASEAERSGLVSRLVAGDALLDEARELAGNIAELPKTAAMMIKESVNTSYETPMAQGLLAERRLFQTIFATSDQEEGMSAYLEKRTPHFRGR